jgi:hypothetical protein
MARPSKKLAAVPEGYMVSEFLTSNFAWFIITNVRGLRVYDRVPYEMDIQVDPTTGKPTRVKIQVDENGKKSSVAKSGAQIVAER